MIRPDDRTPADRRADLEADIRAEAEALTDAEINDGLQKAIRILTADGHRDCTLAIMAACAQVADMKSQIERLYLVGNGA